jgi:transposase-like protein
VRANHEIKRRTEVVGIFPNEAAITRLVGTILLKQNEEWVVQRARWKNRAFEATLASGLQTLMAPA